ncbi:glycosyltransferase family 35 protein [Athelia psychrophila]|uniref:Alpha-1,4 glucan phosphorylase n=1 Tax=Athelia psychrophila TaxID=1759441 RepID=A0A166QSR8_9AGAM|nr:glycosyltransferase family 35 protein [Fibularhizoctonia sp. CBS 109695]
MSQPGPRYSAFSLALGAQTMAVNMGMGMGMGMGMSMGMNMMASFSSDNACPTPIHTYEAGKRQKEIDRYTVAHPLEGMCLSGMRGQVPYHVPFAAHPVGSSVMLPRGVGFQTRLRGFSVDNLVKVEMVLADGRIVIADERETTVGKELRLKQQYFWTAASLADITRRFKNQDKPISAFPEFIAVPRNDTHPQLAIPELMRILIGEEDQSWGHRHQHLLPTRFFLSEVLEKWPVSLLQHVLPRHLQIIFDINLFFMGQVGKKFPSDRERLARMSLIEEGSPQQLHSGLVKTTILKDFVECYGISRFGNVTNGITPRRWLDQRNPTLSALISSTLKIPKEVWLKDLPKLEGLLAHVDANPKLAKAWAEIKQANKERLAHWMQVNLVYLLAESTLSS